MAFAFLVEDGSGQYSGEVSHLGQPTDTDTITISDGTNTAVTFEYDSNASVTSGNISVTIGASASATAANLVTAISAQRVAGLLDVTAEINTDTPYLVLLKNQNITVGVIISVITSGVLVTSFGATNGYASLEEVDTSLAENIHADNWFSLSEGDRERMIVFASKFLDDRTRWSGAKTVETSPMRWPRSGITDRDGRTIGDNEIPEQLKRTVAYIARYYVAQDRTIERDQDGLDSLVVDVIELEFREGYSLSSVPSSLQYMLEGLGTIRGGSTTFGNVLRT